MSFFLSERRSLGFYAMAPAKPPLMGAEVAKHSSSDDCWVIVHVCGFCSVSMSQSVLGFVSREKGKLLTVRPNQGRAYDVTEFLPG